MQGVLYCGGDGDYAEKQYEGDSRDDRDGGDYADNESGSSGSDDE